MYVTVANFTSFKCFFQLLVKRINQTFIDLYRLELLESDLLLKMSDLEVRGKDLKACSQAILGALEKTETERSLIEVFGVLRLTKSDHEEAAESLDLFNKIRTAIRLQLVKLVSLDY